MNSQAYEIPASMRCPLRFYDVNQDTEGEIQESKEAFPKARQELSNKKQVRNWSSEK